MKNIKFVMKDYRVEEADKRYLIRDTVRVNIITTIGAFLVEPIRSQVPALTGSNYRKTIKY
jgi:hypothetical protein